MRVILSVYQLFVSRAKNTNQIIVKPFVFTLYILLLEPYSIVLDVNVILDKLNDLCRGSENMLLMHFCFEEALLLSPLASYQSLFAQLHVCLERASTTSMLFALHMIDSEGANVNTSLQSDGGGPGETDVCGRAGGRTKMRQNCFSTVASHSAASLFQSWIYFWNSKYAASIFNRCPIICSNFSSGLCAQIGKLTRCTAVHLNRFVPGEP